MDINTETKREFDPDIPEKLVNYFASQEAKYSASVRLELDTQRITKVLKVDEQKDAEALAFLLWRARLVHREARVSWADAMNHAWVRSELFKVCNERRKARIAESKARKERLESLILTGADGSVSGEVAA